MIASTKVLPTLPTGENAIFKKEIRIFLKHLSCLKNKKVILTSGYQLIFHPPICIITSRKKHFVMIKIMLGTGGEQI